MVSDTHAYDLDSTLMFISKGGISIDWCLRTGPKTKDKYLTRLQQLWNTAYGGKKKSGEMTLDESGAVDPESLNING